MLSQNYTKLKKYGKYKGFIVNVYDPVNYDIDIYFDGESDEILQELRNRYKDVYISYYTSIALDGATLGERLPCQRAAYRCRVSGISMSRNKDPNREKIIRKATNDINKLIYLYNGWVDLYVSDIDYYNRILIDIFDPITGEPLMNHILNNSYNTIFQKYETAWVNKNKSDNRVDNKSDKLNNISD